MTLKSSPPRASAVSSPPERARVCVKSSEALPSQNEAKRRQLSVWEEQSSMALVYTSFQMLDTQTLYHRDVHYMKQGRTVNSRFMVNREQHNFTPVLCSFVYYSQLSILLHRILHQHFVHYIEVR